MEIEEFHDGNYGAPGEKRKKKRKLTEEQIQKVNQTNKAKLCRHRLLEYFNDGDLFLTLTYEVEKRPQSMKEALKDFQKMMEVVRREFKKRGCTCYWIRNIEQGTKGAWHTHLVITETGDTAAIIRKAWKKGGIYIKEIQRKGEDLQHLAEYMTKSERTRDLKKDGSVAKPRIRASNYGTSRNMPLKPPHVDKLHRWKSEPKPKKGYYIANIYEGINPVTGYRYRRYTMYRLERGKEECG